METARVIEPHAELANRLRTHAQLCAQPGYSLFYAILLERMADDVEAGGPTWGLLEASVERPPRDMPQLRVLGFVHREVLSGRAPSLAVHYPSAEGDGDAVATWPLVRAMFEERADEIRPWLDRAPQTNEVGRCAPLAGGFAVVASETRLPLRILEVGASAGLNLRFDRYRYEAGDVASGDPDSPVRFVDLWQGGRPPFDAPFAVVERRGCDLSPIDPTTGDGRLLLLGYIWPDQHERFELLRGALDIAARVPAAVDRADALEWVPRQLAVSRTGVATVVFHSIALMYFSDEAVERFTAEVTAAGSRASRAASLAWLRLEGAPHLLHAELRLTTWPGGEERLLATATFHHGPVQWLV